MPPRYPYYQDYSQPYYQPYPPRRRKTARTTRKANAMHCPNCGKEIPSSLFDGGHKKPRQANPLSPKLGWIMLAMFVALIVISTIQP